MPVDPREPRPQQPEQSQPAPGLAARMEPRPDHGEESYVGAGRLAERRAVVTGADSGIGRAAAIAFAREGADVTLSYLPAEEEDAQEVKELIERAGRRAVLVPGDLSEEEANVELVRRAVEGLGGLDTVVSVAARQAYCHRIEDLDSSAFDLTMRTNVHALFWLCRAAVSHLEPGSSIITTSSVQASSPSGHLLDCATTKAAIVAFTQALADQLAERGIRANVVAPGPFWTPLQVAGGQPREALPEFGRATPLGRAGQPAECAGAYVYLASDAASYTTGAVLPVTGGKPM